MEKSTWKKIGLVAGGIAAGTIGVKILKSDCAKKLYTNTTAAALRAKECVMTGVTKVKESADDIVADAKDLNEQRAEKAEAAEEIIEDTAREEEQE